MSITFSGLGSGLPINEWVEKLVSVQQAKITPLEERKTELENSSKALGIIKSSFETFRTSVKAFTDLTTNSNLFSKKTATSSLAEFATATTTSKATQGSYSLYVEQLATSTVTKSSEGVGKTLSLDTKLSDIKGSKAGTVSFTFNGSSKTITLGENDTMQDFVDKFNTEFPAVSVSLNNGELAFSTSDTNSFSVGLANDTSNFRNLLKLANDTDAPSGTKRIMSASAISLTNPDASLVGGTANINGTINAGKFKINGQEFEITESTTINQLMTQINSNKDAGVSASFDVNTNKISLTSTATGSIGINMEDTGNTGFFTTFKLNNGAVSTTLGNDAIINLNGSRISSTSNTVSNTGYDGLTINLLKMPASTQEITLNVADDLTDLKKATQTFVDSYNTVVKQIKEATQKDGYLEMDSGLRGISNELRSIVSSLTNRDDKISLLSQIGITTGSVGTAVDTETLTLKFDTTKFDSVCKSNMADVKNLLVNPDTGIMAQFITKADRMLDAESGYFSARSGTFTKQIKLQTEKITKANENLASYQARLEKQFAAMDATIAKMNEQYASFSSTMGKS